MALKKQITLISNFDDAVVFTDSYIKVEKLDGNKNKIEITVFFYKKQNEKVVDSKIYSFVPTLDGHNFIAQAYDYLKTLPEFAGATDC
jgi:hypothetical protein